MNDLVQLIFNQLDIILTQKKVPFVLMNVCSEIDNTG
jgi:hypothetical protein